MKIEWKEVEIKGRNIKALLTLKEKSDRKLLKNLEAINCCPYELACPELKEKLGLNKWLGLIQLSKAKN